MEKYSINGHEVEYDTFDLANMELFDSEVMRVEREVKALRAENANVENYIAMLREQAESVLDFFDTVLGEGTAREVFGGRVNIRDITAAYRGFTEDVVRMRKSLFAGSVASAPANREQRRAAERQKRREEAQRKAAEKARRVTDEAESI